MNVTIKQLLETLILTGSSDLYIMTGATPTMRFRGEIIKLQADPVTSYAVEQMILAILPDDQKLKFAREKALEVALNSPGIGRFKLNLLIQQNRISMIVHALGNEHTVGLNVALNDPALAISNDGQFLQGAVDTKTATMTVMESPSLQFADDDESTHVMDPPPKKGIPKKPAYPNSALPDPWQTGMMKIPPPVPKKKAS